MIRQLLTMTVCGVLVAGCGKKDESLAQRTGEKVGQQLTDFTKGIGKGIDRQMMVFVSLSPDVQALGLSNTVAKAHGLGSDTNGISVYFIASQTVSNALIARAFTADGGEVGRSKTMVVLAKDDAGYFTFQFPEQMDMQVVRKFAIGL